MTRSVGASPPPPPPSPLELVAHAVSDRAAIAPSATMRVSDRAGKRIPPRTSRPAHHAPTGCCSSYGHPSGGGAGPRTEGRPGGTRTRLATDRSGTDIMRCRSLTRRYIRLVTRNDLIVKVCYDVGTEFVGICR